MAEVERLRADLEVFMTSNASLTDEVLSLRAVNATLVELATNAAAVIGTVYTWLDCVEKAGGATSIEGVAACHAMLKSLRRNAARTETLVLAPLRAATAREG